MYAGWKVLPSITWSASVRSSIYRSEYNTIADSSTEEGSRRYSEVLCDLASDEENMATEEAVKMLD